MKKFTTTKIFAFVIAMMMLSCLPQILNAQKQDKGHFCPPCYKWSKGKCIPCRSCCTWLSFIPSPGESSSALLFEPINFSLSGTEPVSLKIYDATGRLIKMFVDRKTTQGENQIDGMQKMITGI